MVRRALTVLAAVVSGLLLTSAPAHAALFDDYVLPSHSGKYYSITLSMSECDTMYVGTQGTCIISLQMWMQRATSHSDLPITGQYDDGPTLSAVQEFERANLFVPDGYFGAEERQALDNWVSDHLAVVGDNEIVVCNPTTGAGCPPSESGGGNGDPGEIESGVSGGSYSGLAVTALGCGGLGLAVGAVATPAAGFGAGVFCDIVTS